MNHNGEAEILFNKSNLLGIGDHELIIKYISDDNNETKTTKFLLSIYKDSLKQLYFNGNLNSNGTYGDSFKDLFIQASDNVLDNNNKVIDGE
ncbi:UNVERIFIED_CONTAM: hypothetical protein O8I53_11625 [Campylobacter lari]